jgi:hypothetical protein
VLAEQPGVALEDLEFRAVGGEPRAPSCSYQPVTVSRSTVSRGTSRPSAPTSSTLPSSPASAVSAELWCRRGSSHPVSSAVSRRSAEAMRSGASAIARHPLGDQEFQPCRYTSASGMPCSSAMRPAGSTSPPSTGRGADCRRAANVRSPN